MKRSILLAIVPCLVALGCGSADSAPAGASTTGGDSPLAAPAVGMQIASTPVTLAAGEERYVCWSFQVPKDKAIDLIALDQKVPVSGVHHYAVFTNSGDLPKVGLDKPYDCLTMGIGWGLVQGGGVGTPGVQFPSGTAMNIAAGTQLILQLHLLNASTSSTSVEPAYVNLIGDDSGKPLQPVGVLIAGTLQLKLPANTATDISGGCAAPDPMENIFAVFPHMHKLGHHIKAELTPSGAKSPTMLNDQAWDFGTQGLYKVAGSAAQGDQVKVTCSFDNVTSKEVDFGLSTTDEMCLEVLFYYPAKTASQYCGLQ